jgi:hypothetical protein
MRFVAIFSLAFALFACAAADTLLTQARILEVTERGFVLQVGTEPLGVEDTSATKYWREGKPVKRGAFRKDDAVHVRLKTDADPPGLREMADIATARWLESVRRDAQKATIERVDARYVHAKFDNGRIFAYRATDKTQVRLKSKADANLADLKPGQTLYLKGRLLPSLDTWLAIVSDEPIAEPAGSKPKAPATKLAPLPQTGKITGSVENVFASLKMFDLNIGARTVHITFVPETRFTFGGAATVSSKLRTGLRASVQYKRDKNGRLVASLIELSEPISG